MSEAPQSKCSPDVRRKSRSTSALSSTSTSTSRSSDYWSADNMPASTSQHDSSNPRQPRRSPEVIHMSRSASTSTATSASSDYRSAEGVPASGSQHELSCTMGSSCRTISGNLALDPVITCKLCLYECTMEDIHQMHMCTCVYCKTCLRQYLNVLTEEGAVSTITCPDAACKERGKMNDQEIQQLLDEKAFTRYKKVKFMKEVEMDPCRSWCPRAGCDTICPVQQEEKQEEAASGSKGDKEVKRGKKVNCPKCGLKFCSICKSPWHGHHGCKKFPRGAGGTTGRSKGPSQLLDMLGIQKDSSEEASIKRCPFCHIPIERDAGCAQMMCKNCQHVFCWYCLANLDNDFLLRHYDKGPCKNKLGHSRTTVIFHRAQIVCVFAGFGFLLLLASPFLLLVAPCILCCKSKWGNMCDDDMDIPES